MKSRIAIISVLFLMLLVALVFSVLYLKDSNRTLEEKIVRMEENYLVRTGGTKLCLDGEFIDYHLRSFDGGKVWYACEIGENWELTILGKAEEVYPGLVNCLDQFQKELDGLLSEKVD